MSAKKSLAAALFAPASSSSSQFSSYLPPHPHSQLLAPAPHLSRARCTSWSRPRCSCSLKCTGDCGSSGARRARPGARCAAARPGGAAQTACTCADSRRGRGRRARSDSPRRASKPRAARTGSRPGAARCGPSAPWMSGAPAARGARRAAHLPLSISSSRTPTLRAAAAHALRRLASALGPARRGRRHRGGGGGRWWMRRRRHGGFAHSRGSGPDIRQSRSGDTRERHFLATLGPRIALAVVRVAI
jgi:hypothetical protein